MSDTIAARLKALDAGTLAALLVQRAVSDKNFRLWLDAELAARDALDQQAPLDPEPFRRQAAALLEPAQNDRRRRHWHDFRSDVDEAALEELVGQAEPFLAAGDGVNALTILRPITEALVVSWPQCADWDETLHEFFPVLDAMLARAALSGNLADDMRDLLVDELSDWQDQVAEYGADDAFAVALAAATLGWDEPGLSEVLDGHASTWPQGGAEDWLSGKLIEARLATLAAMGSTERFLNLSRAAGRHCDHAVMLAKCERFDEALAIAHSRFREPGSVLRLAQALFDSAQADAAFELAHWGLSLPMQDPDAGSGRVHGRHGLARWLRDEAQGASRLGLAVMAGKAAFEESLSSEDYGAAQRLCPEPDWQDLRDALQARLMAAAYAPDRIDILLHENRIDDAMAVVDRKDAGFHSPHDPSLLRLAWAACDHNPDWTIRFALRMANPIMTEGRSSHYDLAVRWLEPAARGHAVAGKTGEWRDLLDTLIQNHRRKHKLRGLLEPMRTTG